MGRWGLRFASNIVSAEGIPIAVINGARGGQPIGHFSRDLSDRYSLRTNYGRLLTRLEMAGVTDALRGVFWYQGEADRGSEQAHATGFEALFSDWETDFPSVERYYVFQIRHTCVPSDTENGQGSVISHFQREFANNRQSVRAVSTTGLDGHDGCHFQYEEGYQTLGDNVSRMVQHDLYGRDLDNADAPDIVSARITGDTTVSLTFTGNNILIGEPGFEALFRLHNAQTGELIGITDGEVSSESVVVLTTDQLLSGGATFTLSYLSLPGAQSWLTNTAGIGIQSFLDVPVVFESVPAADTLVQLQRHLRGEGALSAQELAQWRATFVSQLPSVPRESRLIVLEEAVATIAEYEQIHGPLFTSDGVSSFPAGGSVGDGHDLSRTMNFVYLALFDAIDSDLIADHPEFVEGLAFGLSRYFPGDVEQPVNPSTTYSVDINASVPEDWGRPNLYSRLPARRPTGTYLAPGDIAEVTVPQSLVNKGYQIRVGGHSWDLSKRPTQKRLARATKLYPVTSTVTRVANPLGGGIYLEVPYLADDGVISVGISNVVRAPYLSLRTTMPTMATGFQWDMNERLHPGPWTDIESDKVLISVPSRWIRDYSYAELVELVGAYEEVLDSISDYMGKPHVRNKSIVYMQVDVIMRGVAFFPGYPMGNYPSFDSLTPQSPLDLSHPLNATFLHEHGHATYMTKFQNEREAAVHMLYVAAATEVYGMDLYEAFSRSLHYTDQRHIRLADAFASWALRPSFANNANMDHAEAGYRYAGHADYVEIIDLFGIEVMQRFNRTLNVDYVETGYDFNRNAHDPGDRILRLSRAAGVDLTPLIHMWGVVPPSSLASQISAEGLLPSARLYDRMVSYRDAIPLTQASYNAFHAKMSSTLWYRDYWDALANEFDPAIGEAALAQLNVLIGQYFPNGRPDDPAVRVYSEDGNTGTWITLPDGEYDRAALNALGVGEGISSVRITAGVSSGVTLCSGEGDSRVCANHVGDVGDVGNAGSAVTHVLVGPAPVTIYQHVNFGGTQWPLTLGVYDESAVEASPLQLNQASSIRVAPGYAVRACESVNQPASCVEFSASAASLVTMGVNDRFNWFDVTFTADNRFFPNSPQTTPSSVEVASVSGGGIGAVTLLCMGVLGLRRRVFGVAVSHAV